MANEKEWVLSQTFGIDEITLEIHADLILSDTISCERPLADADVSLAVSLFGQRDAGYLTVYPRPSRQAPIAR